ncbi:MAG: SWIM zinc finger family protein, partial [Acidobacteriota bacterium]|nr:SWIM zinc finger family protein [Acidobacteriota bacterium]
MTATAQIAEFDLSEVEAAVGEAAFSRGRSYAQGGRVIALAWEDSGTMLHGQVLGHGALYDTAAYFSADGFEFQDGECSCPVGYDCKHVAALAIAAAD